MNGSTQLVGIIGWPVSHSKSPTMHGAAFAKLNLNWAYVPMPVQPSETSVGQAIKGLAALGFKGVNVTVPHKESVIPFLDDLSPAARAIGAVNTIAVDESGRLLGHNTDAPGLIMDLREHDVDVTTRKTILLGAGGSARATLYGLLEAGCRDVVVLNRSIDRAKALVEDVGAHFSHARVKAHVLDEDHLRQFSHFDLIINSTSLGMGKQVDDMPWSENISFSADQVVYDLVYNPNPTRLLKHASQGGARAINGLGMLVHQGALSFELWTGQKAPVDVMKAAVFNF